MGDRLESSVSTPSLSGGDVCRYTRRPRTCRVTLVRHDEAFGLVGLFSLTHRSWRAQMRAEMRYQLGKAREVLLKSGKQIPALAIMGRS